MKLNSSLRTIVVAQIFASTIEDMASLPAKPVPFDQLISIDDGSLWGKVTAETRSIRWLAVQMPIPLLVRMAEAVLGVPGGTLKDAQIHDLVGEIANIVCGALLRQVATVDKFSLGLPTVSRELADEPSERSEGAQLEVCGMRANVIVQW